MNAPIEAKRRYEIKRDLRPYGCQFDGTETTAHLEELHRLIIGEPAKAAEAAEAAHRAKLSAQYMGMVAHNARNLPRWS